MNQRSLIDRLVSACVGGCSCGTKTPDIEFHNELCHYRLHFEAIEALQRASERAGDAYAAGYSHGMGKYDSNESYYRGGGEAMFPDLPSESAPRPGGLLSDLKRWHQEFQKASGSRELVEAVDGEWVSYEDVERLVDEVRLIAWNPGIDEGTKLLRIRRLTFQG